MVEEAKMTTTSEDEFRSLFVAHDPEHAAAFAAYSAATEAVYDAIKRDGICTEEHLKACDEAFKNLEEVWAKIGITTQ